MKSPAYPNRSPVGCDTNNPLASTRGHLIGKQFGGSAKNPRNFVPMGNSLNGDAMNAVEGIIAAKIKAAPNGETVQYDVIPLYPDDSTGIPSAVHLVATGAGLSIDCTITNELVPVPDGQCS